MIKALRYKNLDAFLLKNILTKKINLILYVSKHLHKESEI